jgi:hypothetical protein
VKLFKKGYPLTPISSPSDDLIGVFFPVPPEKPESKGLSGKKLYYVLFCCLEIPVFLPACTHKEKSTIEGTCNLVFI